MRKSETYKGNFLKAEALDKGGGKYGTMVVTISEVSSHEFDDGKKQRVLSFKGIDQQLGLNVTNWDSIAEITGKDDDDEWIGARIELYVDKNVMYGGKKMPAIRIRAVGGGDSGDGAAPKVKDKVSAWNAYCAIEKSEGRIKPDAERWKALVAGVVESAGLPSHEMFDAGHWQAVIDAAEKKEPAEAIPAGDIPF